MWKLLSSLGGPIFAKECVDISRRPRYIFIRIIYALMLLLGLLSIWQRQSVNENLTPKPDDSINSPITPQVKTKKTPSGILQTQARFANNMVHTTGLTEMIAVYVLTPLLLSGAIVAERRGGNFELLCTTHLTNREIVFGKFGSRLAIVTLLILGTAPVLMLTLLFGGVSWTVIIGYQIAALVAAFFVASISIYFAVTSTNEVRATMMSYLVAITTTFLLPCFSPFLPLYFAMQEGSAYMLIGVAATSIAPVAIAVTVLFRAIEQLDSLPELAEGSTRRHSQFNLAETIRRRRRFTKFDSSQRGSTTLNPIDDADVRMEMEESAGNSPLRRSKLLWAPLRVAVDAQDRPISNDLWIFVVLGGAFAYCSFTLRFTNPVGSGLIGFFIVPIWAFALAVTASLAINNPLFTKRPGFFDVLLQTTLEKGEVLGGAVFVALPVLLRLFLAPTLLSFLWIAANPVGMIGACLLSLTLAALLLGLGSAASLADFRTIERSAPMALFVLGTLLIPWYAKGFIPFSSMPLVCLTLAGLTAICLMMLLRSPRPISIGLTLLLLHLTSSALFVGLPIWFIHGSDDKLELGEIAPLTGFRRVTSPFELLYPPGWYYALSAVDDQNRWNPTWSYFPLYLVHCLTSAGLIWAYCYAFFDRLVDRPAAKTLALSASRPGRLDRRTTP